MTRTEQPEGSASIVEKTALVVVIRAERERHKNLGPEQMVFNVRCACGHVGQQVSVRGEFEQHVDECVADAVLAHLSARSVPEQPAEEVQHGGRKFSDYSAERAEHADAEEAAAVAAFNALYARTSPAPGAGRA